MHCQWRRNIQIAPSPWYFVAPPEENRATAISNMHKNLVEVVHVVPEILPRTDRHRHTDVLITILRHRSRGRSYNYYGSSE